jgi:glyoxylase-like metal-dependent hydrolase (beta-lactamase superfamily II)
MPQLEKVYSSRNQRRAEYVAEDVAYLTIGFVNVYFIGAPGGPWVLVDTGLPRTASWTLQAAAELFGSEPDAIILTHGHIDHAGAVDDLSRAWRVPVYAHPLELPYLKGKSDYPPRDSSMGGAIAQMARLIPTRGMNLGRRVHALPEDGTIPGLEGWRWIHTPGHTHGHISLFRDSDRVLLAGDAVATVDMDSWSALAAELPHIARPAAPFTTDWEAAQESVRALFALRPSVVAAGHGVPVFGSAIMPALRALVTDFPLPRRGRYRTQPAIADARGVLEVPPPVSDPYPALVLGAAIGAFIGIGLLRQRRRGFVQRMLF